MQAPDSLTTARRLAALLFLHTVVLKLVEVGSTAGFVGRVGVQHLPWLWLADTVVALLGGAALARIVDRVHRGALLASVFAAFGLGLLACVIALRWGAPPAWVYTAAYLWSALQVTLLPLAFWPLANDLLAARGENRYGLVAAGASAGQLSGYLLAAAAAVALGSSPAMDTGSLLTASGLCLVGALLARRRGGAPTTSTAAASHLRPVLRIPGLRWLAASVALHWFAATWLLYRVVAALADVAAHTEARFSVVFAFYNVGSVVLILAAQAILSARLLARVGLDRAPTLLPATMVACVAVVACVPGLVAAVACECAVYIVQDAADVPARHALIGRAPPALRGRATALVDNHAYAIGSALGATALLAARPLPEWVGAALALAAAVGALLAARRLRGASFDVTPE